MVVLKSFLYVVYVCSCIFLILLVLLQRGAEDDLGGAFGGGSSGTENLLGARGDKTLKKITAVLATLFFVLSVVLGALELNVRQASSLQTEKKNVAPVPTDKNKDKKSHLESEQSGRFSTQRTA